MGGFPSGQREQTVNLPSQTSMVRIHPCPPKSFSLPGRHILREWRNWQTRMIQVHVFVRTCRFKSCFPHHGTLEKSRAPIFLCAEIPKPYPNDTQSSHVFNEGLHPVCRFAAHGVRHVTVAIQRECRGIMPHVFRRVLMSSPARRLFTAKVWRRSCTRWCSRPAAARMSWNSFQMVGCE